MTDQATSWEFGCNFPGNSSDALSTSPIPARHDLQTWRQRPTVRRSVQRFVAFLYRFVIVFYAQGSRAGSDSRALPHTGTLLAALGQGLGRQRAYDSRDESGREGLGMTEQQVPFGIPMGCQVAYQSGISRERRKDADMVIECPAVAEDVAGSKRRHPVTHDFHGVGDDGPHQLSHELDATPRRCRKSCNVCRDQIRRLAARLA